MKMKFFNLKTKRLLCILLTTVLMLGFFVLPVSATQYSNVLYKTDRTNGIITAVLGDSRNLYSTASVRTAGGINLLKSFEYYYRSGQNAMSLLAVDNYFSDQLFVKWNNTTFTEQIDFEFSATAGNEFYGFALPVVTGFSIPIRSFSSYVPIKFIERAGNYIEGKNTIETDDFVACNLIGFDIVISYYVYAFDEDTEGSHYREGQIVEYVPATDMTSLSDSQNIFLNDWLELGLAKDYEIEFTRPLAIKSISIRPTYQFRASLIESKKIDTSKYELTDITKRRLDNISAMFVLNNEIEFTGFTNSNLNYFYEIGEEGDLTQMLIQSNQVLKNLYSSIGSEANSLSSVVGYIGGCWTVMGSFFTQLSNNIFVRYVLIVCLSSAVVSAFCLVAVAFKKRRE